MEVVLLETEGPALYQRLSRKALHLQELGLSYSAIARRLEVDDKTIAKAIRWLRTMGPHPDRSESAGVAGVERSGSSACGHRTLDRGKARS